MFCTPSSRFHCVRSLAHGLPCLCACLQASETLEEQKTRAALDVARAGSRQAKEGDGVGKRESVHEAALHNLTPEEQKYQSMDMSLRAGPGTITDYAGTQAQHHRLLGRLTCFLSR